MSVLVRMPAETEPHERTLVAWPTTTRKDDLWRGELEAARRAHTELVRAVAQFEPVLVVADPADRDDAHRRLETMDGVDIVALPIDDSWLRDSGPIIVRTPAGPRCAVHFRFNAWGGKYTPYDNDAAVGLLVAEHLGLGVAESTLVLEGGSIAVDGQGVLVTTERCLLNPNRNPDLARGDIEMELRAYLGVAEIVWLPDGIAEDDETDGHVDNVVAFLAPGAALLQGCADPENPNRAIAAENRKRLEANGIDVVEVPHLRYSDRGDPVPYVNLYACNGAVIVPIVGGTPDALDRDVLALIASCYPGREVVAVPGAILAMGGGGVHCITQQVPAQ